MTEEKKFCVLKQRRDSNVMDMSVETLEDEIGEDSEDEGCIEDTFTPNFENSWL